MTSTTGMANTSSTNDASSEKREPGAQSNAVHSDSRRKTDETVLGAHQRSPLRHRAAWRRLTRWTIGYGLTSRIVLMVTTDERSTTSGHGGKGSSPQRSDVSGDTIERYAEGLLNRALLRGERG